jgi:hypothetical protein
LIDAWYSQELAQAGSGAADVVSKDQEEYIQKEIERRIELDKWDVKFLGEGRLDLFAESVSAILQPDDELWLRFKVP